MVQILPPLRAGNLADVTWTVTQIGWSYDELRVNLVNIDEPKVER
jgi:hypothetical protein